jgi:hypothetical protein
MAEWTGGSWRFGPVKTRRYAGDDADRGGTIDGDKGGEEVGLGRRGPKEAAAAGEWVYKTSQPVDGLTEGPSDGPTD